MQPTLIGKPYRSPKLAVGDEVYCERRCRDVAVDRTVSPPIGGKWVAEVQIGGRTLPILTGELSRAVRTESVQAVAFWWGVSRKTVYRWRKALGVVRFNEGTSALWRQLSGQKLPLAARLRGANAMRLRAKPKQSPSASR